MTKASDLRKAEQLLDARFELHNLIASAARDASLSLSVGLDRISSRKLWIGHGDDLHAVLLERFRAELRDVEKELADLGIEIDSAYAERGRSLGMVAA